MRADGNPRDRETLLDEVIAAYLDAREAGEAPDRQVWLARHPELADELAAYFADEDQFDSLVAPLRSPTPVTPAAADTPLNGAAGPHTGSSGLAETTTPGLRRIGEYDILGEIARGGMGVIYKARHRQLRRLVALKMILTGSFAAAADVERFRREAEAVAHLDHPNIVPIYEIGEHEGQPFFAMKLIEGDSLAQWIADCRLQIADLTAAQHKNMAALLATVARAVHHAHQRGLLHRDLKPSNVLLQVQKSAICNLQSAIPFVTDFGLAKWVAGRSSQAATSPRVTQSGIAVGTPSYMAPEQATGRHGDLTTAADIYSLGAILYELLTGRPPFRAGSALETLCAALEREPERPGTLNPRVDRDLETICLKCLEKEPARRYASAAALADDLERYLAQEPIQARPLGTAGRLLRWCRRQPIVAGLVAALLLSLVAGLGLTTWQWRRAEANFDEAETLRGRAETHLAEAQSQRDLAETAFRQAHQAVEAFCIRLSEDRLSDVPGMQPLRKELLDGALKYYEDFARRRASDPALQADLAGIHFRIGTLTSAIGSRERALEAYQRAVTIYELLREADPADRKARAGLARTYINLGLLQSGTGRTPEALKCYQDASALLTALAAEDPANPEHRHNLSIAYTNTGGILRAGGDLDKARESFAKAHTLLTALVRDHPRVPGYRMGLAISHVNLGVLHAVSGRDDEALRAYEEARRIQEKIEREGHKSLTLPMDLGLNYRRIGEKLCTRGRYEESVKILEMSRALFARLARENPAVAGYQTNLASSLQSLGHTYWRSGQGDKALPLYQEAVRILDKLVPQHPSVAGNRAQLASTWFEIGLFHGFGGRGPQALDAYEHARRLQENLVAAETDNLDARAALARTLNNLGLMQDDQRHTKEAIATLRQALEHEKQAIARAPHSLRDRKALRGTSSGLARVYRTSGNAAEGLRCLREASALFEDLRRAHPDDASFQRDLAACHTLLGRFHRDNGQPAAAIEALQQAKALRVQLAQQTPDVPQAQQELALCSFDLGLASARAGRWPEARRAYAEARDLQQALTTRHPEEAAYHSDLGNTLNNLGLLLDHTGQAAEGVAVLRQAVASQQRALAGAPLEGQYRRALSTHYGALGGLLRKGNQLAEAVAVARERQKLWRNDPSQLLDVAADFARATAMVGNGKAALTDKEQAERRRYGDEALAALRQAVGSGLRGRQRVENHPALTVLRDRDDFQRLLEQVPK